MENRGGAELTRTARGESSDRRVVRDIPDDKITTQLVELCTVVLEFDDNIRVLSSNKDCHW